MAIPEYVEPAPKAASRSSDTFTGIATSPMLSTVRSYSTAIVPSALSVLVVTVFVVSSSALMQSSTGVGVSVESSPLSAPAAGSIPLSERSDTPAVSANPFAFVWFSKLVQPSDQSGLEKSGEYTTSITTSCSSSGAKAKPDEGSTMFVSTTPSYVALSGRPVVLLSDTDSTMTPGTLRSSEIWKSSMNASGIVPGAGTVEAKSFTAAWSAAAAMFASRFA